MKMEKVMIEKVQKSGMVISGKFAKGKIAFDSKGNSIPATDVAVRAFAAQHHGAAKAVVALLLSGEYSDSEIATIIKIAATTEEGGKLFMEGKLLPPEGERELDKKCASRIASMRGGIKSKNAPSESYKKLT